MRPFLQAYDTPSAVAIFRGLKSIVVVFCIGACSLTHAATIEFSGQLDVILINDGGAIYSDVQTGTFFSGAIDDATFDGVISDGATLTPFTEFGRGGMWTENDQIMDADEAMLINSLAGTSFVAGDLYDEIEMGGAASTSGGGEIEISLVFLLDPLAFDNNPVDYYPPNPDDILLVIFLIEELDEQEEVIYLALGGVDWRFPLIDIKPGSDPNGINPRGEGVIAVAILGSIDFDATQVDFTTVEFGPDRATPVHDGHVKDVNTDGYPDFVMHFETLDTGIACGDTHATLIGSTVENAFIGMDSVKTAGCTVPQSVYFNDFDGGLTVAPGVTDVLDGITTTEPVQDYGGVGSFGSDFLRNTTGGAPIGTPGELTRLTLTGLRKHNSIDINFLLAIIDSWDGSLPGSPPPGGDFYHPDIFNVRVDGIVVFDESFGFNVPTFVPPPGVLLDEYSVLGFNGDWNDAAYDMGLNPTFDNIPHTARTLTIEWFADGAGWQGGDDESWAIDNLEIILNEE